MSENEFIETLKKDGINLNDEQILLFRKYADFLLEYNKNVNLTAIRNTEEVYLKHFYDSLLLCKFIKSDNESILDIGSGAGFPGVPLKIVFPNIKLTMLDSNGKKTIFLDKLKKELVLDYTVVNDRAEKYVEKCRELFDIVTARAVTQMPILAELCIPFVKLGGKFIAYKGQLDETIENGLYAIQELGGEFVKTEKTILPKDNASRIFVFVNKKCKTKSEYPRVFDKINKKTLQKSQI